MGIFDWAEKKIQNLNVWEFGLVKLVLVLFGIILGAFIAVFVKRYVWYFVSAFVILWLLTLFLILRK